jgi:hypothetical protein
MNLLKAFGWFWWELVIGDDWRIAAYVVVVLGTATLLAANGVDGPYVALVALVGLMTCFAVFVSREARR